MPPPVPVCGCVCGTRRHAHADGERQDAHRMQATGWFGHTHSTPPKGLKTPSVLHGWTTLSPRPRPPRQAYMHVHVNTRTHVRVAYRHARAIHTSQREGGADDDGVLANVRRDRERLLHRVGRGCVPYTHTRVSNTHGQAGTRACRALRHAQPRRPTPALHSLRAHIRPPSRPHSPAPPVPTRATRAAAACSYPPAHTASGTALAAAATRPALLGLP